MYGRVFDEIETNPIIMVIKCYTRYSDDFSYPYEHFFPSPSLYLYHLDEMLIVTAFACEN